MGWKGYEAQIHIGMLFRKMYCHKCGNRLKKKKISSVINKGAPDYSNKLLGHATLGMDKIEKNHYVYFCPQCFTEITYEEQLAISKKNRKNI